MKAIIITIGDEILLGQILDTNSQYISRQLTRLGAEVADILSIADQREEIWQWVDYAMKQAELIIVTGGLGPTKDDVTKKVLAEYFDTRLVMNEDVLKWIGKLLENGGMIVRLSYRNRPKFFTIGKGRLPGCGLNGTERFWCLCRVFLSRWRI